MAMEIQTAHLFRTIFIATNLRPQRVLGMNVTVVEDLWKMF